LRKREAKPLPHSLSSGSSCPLLSGPFPHLLLGSCFSVNWGSNYCSLFMGVFPMSKVKTGILAMSLYQGYPCVLGLLSRCILGKHRISQYLESATEACRNFWGTRA
jgi:hypothetical protein